jgi:hypothetical protein
LRAAPTQFGITLNALNADGNHGREGVGNASAGREVLYDNMKTVVIDRNAYGRGISS